MIKINHFYLQTNLGTVLNHKEIAFLSFLHNNTRKGGSYNAITASKAVALIGCISVRTFFRMVKKLKVLGILIIEKLSKNKWDRINHYKINYDKIQELLLQYGKNFNSVHKIHTPSLDSKKPEVNSNISIVNDSINIDKTVDDANYAVNLKALADKYGIRKTQLLNLAKNKTQEEINNLIIYVENSISSGTIDNPAGYIISAFRYNYQTEVAANNNTNTVPVLTAQEQKLVEFNSKAYYCYEKGYNARIDNYKLELNNVDINDPSPITSYLKAARKSNNMRQKAYKLLTENNLFEDFIDNVDFKKTITENYNSGSIDINNFKPDELIFPVSEEQKQKRLNNIKSEYLDDIKLKYNEIHRNFIYKVKNELSSDQLRLIDLLCQTQQQLIEHPIEVFESKQNLTPHSLAFKEYRFESFVNSFLKIHNVPTVDDIKASYIEFPINEVLNIEETEILNNNIQAIILDDIIAYLNILTDEYNKSYNATQSYTEEILKIREILRNNQQLILREEVKLVFKSTMGSILSSVKSLFLCESA